MLKALRTFKEKTGPSSGEDADDKKRISEIRDAAVTLQRTLGYFFKTMLDHAANTAAVHEDLANLYPASQACSGTVAQLNSAGAVFHDTPALVEELRRVLERPIDKIINRTKELIAAAEERQVLRAEIEHYKTKVVKLANEGLGDAKKQSKAESNQEKLLANQKRFGELNAHINSALSTIDAEIGAATDAAIATYAQMQANYASGLLHCFGAAMASLPGDLRATAGIAAAEAATSTSAATARPLRVAPTNAAPLSSGGGADPEAGTPVAGGSLSDFLGGGGGSVPLTIAAVPLHVEGEEEGGGVAEASGALEGVHVAATQDVEVSDGAAAAEEEDASSRPPVASFNPFA